MVQLAMLLFAFPLGAARWSRRAAYASTLAVFVITLIPQTMSQRHEEQTLPISYWVVQGVTLIAAYALVTWGSRWGQRRARRVAASRGGALSGRTQRP